ncbi:MAG: histidine--tRNA ligase [Desulfohalobiaceae bacterium]|nr:histidine--tRNA ligase [Desulfohalobiaceae bacterium]
MSSIGRIRGFSDILGQEARKFRFMEDRAHSVFSRYGFRELRLPMLEHTELFARSIGSDTDVVQKEMFTFPDRKGRHLTLRPEATAGAVRAYIEDKLYSGGGLTKLFTVGPMFRYERPQKGRQRQFHQVNAEAFGSASPLLDAEMILMLWTYLRELGLTDLTLQINSLGCRECQPVYAERLQDYLAHTDRSRFCADCQERAQRNPFRLLDCKQSQCQELMRGAPSMLDSVCSDCRSHLDTVLDSLQQLGIPYEVNSGLVRGLDYYQRTTFEIVSGAIGAQSSVAGGGRYDDLVRQLGGPDHPAIGFACGMERLSLLLEDPGPEVTDFYLAVLDPEGFSEGMRICEELRRKGWKGEMNQETASVKSQTRHAHRLGARFCLFLGQEELARESITVKDMSSGQQSQCGKEHLPDMLRQ